MMLTVTTNWSTSVHKHRSTCVPATPKLLSIHHISLQTACSRTIAARHCKASVPSLNSLPSPSRRGSIATAAASNNPSSDRLKRVLAKIDELNSQDPRSAEVAGQKVPYELAYSRWMTEWVSRLTADGSPAASEELLIAARGQHVQRWTSPRSSYPEGRAAYLKWREDLKKFHSSTVTAIMRQEGYSEESCAKVSSIMLKKNLKDPEGQVVEDALCLVFLEQQFTELREKESEEKMIDILRKTWRKMGEKGRAAALALAPAMPAENRALVEKALAA